MKIAKLGYWQPASFKPAPCLRDDSAKTSGLYSVSISGKLFAWCWTISGVKGSVCVSVSLYTVWNKKCHLIKVKIVQKKLYKLSLKHCHKRPHHIKWNFYLVGMWSSMKIVQYHYLHRHAGNLANWSPNSIITVSPGNQNLNRGFFHGTRDKRQYPKRPNKSLPLGRQTSIRAYGKWSSMKIPQLDPKFFSNSWIPGKKLCCKIISSPRYVRSIFYNWD